jgi:hypothetical protein
MSRPPEPEFLIQWRVWYQAGPPMCCHTCDNYDENGHCQQFDMQPPENFAATQDACNKWTLAVPF